MTTAKPHRDLMHLLSRAEHLAARRLTAVLEAEAAGCSIEQWRVLNLLADGEGHPMAEVADYALLPAPTATKLVDRLVADNIVYRRPDPADRRRVLAYASDRGRELHARLALSLDRMQSDLMEAVGDTGELEQLLAHIADACDPNTPRAPRLTI